MAVKAACVVERLQLDVVTTVIRLMSHDPTAQTSKSAVAVYTETVIFDVRLSGYQSTAACHAASPAI